MQPSGAGGVGQADQTRLLATLGQLLAIEASALADALGQASQLVAGVLGADKVDAFLYDPAEDALAAVGVSDTPMGRWERVIGMDVLPLAGGGRTVQVFRTGHPYLTGNAEGDPKVLAGFTEGLGVRSILSAPLTVDGSHRGVLEVFSARPDAFTPDDLAFLTAVARWVGLVAHRADLLERTARDATREAEQRAHLQAVVETAPVILFATDHTGVITLSAGKALGALGRTPSESVGLSVFELYRDAPAVSRHVRRALAGEASTATIEVAGVVLEAHWTPQWDRDGRVAGVIGVAVDVTERARLLEEAQAAYAVAERARQETAALLDSSGDGIFSLDAQGCCVTINRAAAALLGYAPDVVIGRNMHALIHHHRRDGAPYPYEEGPLARAVRTGQVVRMEDEVVWRRDGTYVLAAYCAAPIQQGGDITGMVVTLTDTTARRQAAEALRHQALHDALTGLPNRALLLDRLAQALLAGARGRAPLALLLLDLDGFKEVNDTFGHHIGDALLRQVGLLLQGALRASDTVARLGGDEFAVLLLNDDRSGAEEAARKIGAALAAPVVVDGQALYVDASIGVALYPAHGDDDATLLRHADVAMYAAKRARRGYAVYDPAQDQHTPNRHALANDLRAAVAAGAFSLVYQPVVDLGAGRPTHVEALLRWPRPERGPLPPDQFIPLAEQTGLIEPLTRWVVDAALRQCRDWRAAALDLGMAVNLSVANLHDPELVETIARLLATYDIPPARLRLELTESTLMADTTRALAVLTRLSALGVRVSVDDFGTGYSSLTYLKRLPVDELKIDKSFVLDLMTDAANQAIVSSTIGLGHGLGLRVVAEGVESRDVRERLAALGCDAAQGYDLSRPLAAPDLEPWLRAMLQP